MNRRLAVVLLLFAFAPHLRADDWRAELLAYLGSNPDYAGAESFLKAQVSSLKPEDLQTAQALLPYLADKLGRNEEEQDLICAYFEKYSDNDPDFAFLDGETFRDFLSFWERWKSTYPVVTDLNFLSYPAESRPALPASVQVGLELSNGAYYRLSLGPYVLEGGFWAKGFHILTLPVSGLFEQSGVTDFLLDLKAGDLVVRRPIRIAVDIKMGAPVAPAPATPVLRDTNRRSAEPPSLTALTGEIDLYVGDKLILKSRKIPAKIPPMDIPLPGPAMPGQKPYMPPPTTGPMATGVSILDALALTYKTLKDLFSKKPQPPSPPAYQKVSSLFVSYVHTDSDGQAADAQAVIRLERAGGRILRE
jgi:hypothetical protein